jgi:hypothetical protein
MVFESRAFFTIKEILDLEIVPRPTMRRWLKQAGCITKNPGGRSVVTRANLEAAMPWLLEEIGRRVSSGERGC